MQWVSRRVARWGAVAALLVVGTTSVAEAQRRRPEYRFLLSIDGGAQAGSQLLQDVGVTGSVFGEDRVVRTDYDVDRGAGMFRGNATVSLWRNWGFGLGFTRTASTGGADVTVEVPHPVFVDRPRVVSRTLSTLAHRENMYHFQAVWMAPLDDRVDLQIFGGPTVMSVDQAVVTDAVTREVGFPFNEIRLSQVRVVEMEESGLGFIVGGDFSYMLGELYGIGAFVQYAGGSMDFDLAGGSTSVWIGGLQFGGGLRLRF